MGSRGHRRVLPRRRLLRPDAFGVAVRAGVITPRRARVFADGSWRDAGADRVIVSRRRRRAVGPRWTPTGVRECELFFLFNAPGPARPRAAARSVCSGRRGRGIRRARCAGQLIAAAAAERHRVGDLIGRQGPQGYDGRSPTHTVVMLDRRVGRRLRWRRSRSVRRRRRTRLRRTRWTHGNTTG